MCVCGARVTAIVWRGTGGAGHPLWLCWAEFEPTSLWGSSSGLPMPAFLVPAGHSVFVPGGHTREPPHLLPLWPCTLTLEQQLGVMAPWDVGSVSPGSRLPHLAAPRCLSLCLLDP